MGLQRGQSLNCVISALAAQAAGLADTGCLMAFGRSSVVEPPW
jgi:hypothetical protein